MVTLPEKAFKNILEKAEMLVANIFVLFVHYFLPFHWQETIYWNGYQYFVLPHKNRQLP